MMNMWTGPFLKLLCVYSFSTLPLIIRNHSSVKALGNKEISTRPLFHITIDLNPPLCILAPLIDTVLDNNNPLIALNAGLMEREMWKVLH